jgi:hypothetical protein
MRPWQLARYTRVAEQRVIEVGAESNDIHNILHPDENPDAFTLTTDATRIGGSALQATGEFASGDRRQGILSAFQTLANATA